MSFAILALCNSAALPLWLFMHVSWCFVVRKFLLGNYEIHIHQNYLHCPEVTFQWHGECDDDVGGITLLTYQERIDNVMRRYGGWWGSHVARVRRQRMN